MVGEGDRVAIVLQDDPDPDAMASAMALRTLLGRNKQTTPFFAFKPVTRPENRTMVHLLEIEIQPADHRGAARVRQDRDGRRAAAVLRRENSARRYRHRSSSRLPRRRRAVRGRAHQIRRDRHHHDRVPGHRRRKNQRAPGDRAALWNSQRHAGAVATRDRRRPAGVHASLSARELQPAPADRSSRAAAEFRADTGARDEAAGRSRMASSCSISGTVERDDLIVQMADFCLQFEGVAWVAVAGKLGSKLVISVRNHGMRGAQRGRSGQESVRRNRQRRRPSQHVQGGDPAARVAPARGHHARLPKSNRACANCSAAADPWRAEAAAARGATARNGN